MNTMNQGGNLRYFPQLDPGMVKYKFRLMTLMGNSRGIERLPLVRSISGIVRVTIWYPLGLAFQGRW